MAINLDEIVAKIEIAATAVTVMIIAVTVAALIVGLIAAAVALGNDEEYLDKLPERENEDEQQRNCDLPVLQEEEKQRE